MISFWHGTTALWLVDRRICLCYNASCCTAPISPVSPRISTSCIMIIPCLTSARPRRTRRSPPGADHRAKTAPPRPPPRRLHPPPSPLSALASASRPMTGINYPRGWSTAVIITTAADCSNAVIAACTSTWFFTARRIAFQARHILRQFFSGAFQGFYFFGGVKF